MDTDDKAKRRGAENAEERRVKTSLRLFAASAPLRFAPSVANDCLDPALLP